MMHQVIQVDDLVLVKTQIVTQSGVPAEESQGSLPQGGQAREICGGRVQEPGRKSVQDGHPVGPSRSRVVT